MTDLSPLADPFRVLCFGPPQHGASALTAALQKHLAPQKTAPSASALLLPSHNLAYPIHGLFVQHFHITNENFPGPLLYANGENHLFLLVLRLNRLAEIPLFALFSLLKAIQCRQLLIFLNGENSSLDAASIHAAQEKINAALQMAEWPTSHIFFAQGNAQQIFETEQNEVATQLFSELTATMAQAFRQFKSILPEKQRFVMSIEDRFTLNKNQSVATGRIEQGRIAEGDTVTLIGEKKCFKTIAAIEMFRRLLPDAKAGDHVALILAETLFHELNRGDILTTAPELFQQTQTLQVVVYFRTEETGGYHGPFAEGEEFSIYPATREHKCTMKPNQAPLWRWHPQMAPGHTTVVDLEFERPSWFRKGQLFTIHHQGKAAGVGRILAL